MSTSNRRCHSEQILPKQPVSFQHIEPHRSVKLRYAQLRQYGFDLQPQQVFSAPSRGDGAIPARSVIPASEQQLSAPHPFPQGTRSAERRLRNSTCPISRQEGAQDFKHLREAANLTRQLDGAEHLLPSIDAVMFGARYPDNQRRAAESEFYEQKDEHGVVGRRSMMRTVDKDDKLLARGANPRTGLITPEVQSLAGSLDDDELHRRKALAPSAKWELQDDQWVSIGGQKTRAGDLVRASGRRGASATLPNKKEPAVSMIKSLTSENLQALERVSERRQNESDLQHDMTLDVPKILRKAVGSPPKVQSNNALPRLHVKTHGMSNETVVRRRASPDQFRGPIHEGNTPGYFSPDDVGRNVKYNRQLDHSEHTQPFLGVPVKPCNRNMAMTQPQCFAKNNGNFDPIWLDLQTSSGPYQSLPLGSRPLPPKRENPHLDTNSIPRVQVREYDIRRVDPVMSRRAVLKVSHPSVASLPTCRPQLQLPDCHNIMSQEGKPAGQVNWKAAPSSKEDYRLLSWVQESRPMQTSSITSMSTPTSSRQKKPQRDTSGSITMSFQNILNPSQAERRDEGQSMMTAVSDCTVTHPSCQDRDAKGQWTQDAQRFNGPQPINSHPHQKGEEDVTTMVPKARSRATGMPERVTRRTGVEYSADDAFGEDKSCSSNMSATTNAVKVNLFPQAISPFDVVSRTATNNTVLTDHSTCCPECCAHFDCHESCLGHPSPNASTKGSEVSSLTSVGIFDGNFETSVKAVNEALLTPWTSRNSQLRKLKAAFVKGSRYGTSPPVRPPISEEGMKKTLRSSPPRQKYDPVEKQPRRPVVKGPRDRRAGEAKVAAQKAMCEEDNSPVVSKPVTSVKLTQSPVVKPPQILKSKKEARPIHEEGNTNTQELTPPGSFEANKGRRVISKTRTVSFSSLPDDTRSDSGSIETTASRSSRITRTDLLNKLISRDLIKLNYIEKTSAMVDRAQVIGRRLQEMLIVVSNTTVALSCMIFEYKRTGILSLPEGTSAAELAANCIRSTLYLMIATCVCALVVKTSKVVLMILRIVLLPAKLCAWIIG
ncbi:hypothetical protein H2198_009112 [Neophaeococcomyces mojaviensis]|uniref:Uncharacterized protein n=1 Tax=Neophaeococcomyces mojaviensis TaxID=3383035 RepID=A0ACC2ZVD8_9EURO|nr:hypothetical protein H2198_009112 [Knufia sp. JES_112]